MARRRGGRCRCHRDATAGSLHSRAMAARGRVGFEPVGTAHMTRLKAVLDPSGKPIDWTCEVWAGSHVQRPIFGGALLAHEADAGEASAPKPNDPGRRGRWRQRHGNAALRFSGETDRPSSALTTPVRTSSLRASARCRTCCAGMFHGRLANGRGRSGDVAPRAIVRPTRRRLLENVAERCDWSSAAQRGGARPRDAWARYKNKAAYAAVAVEIESTRRCMCVERGSPPTPDW